MTRRRLILLLLLLVGLPLPFIGRAKGATKPAAPRTNIVLVVADDLGYGDVGCYGRTEVETPRLDRLAQEGIRFTDFCVNPLCAPTRASVLTGLYSMENGMWRGPSEKKEKDSRTYRGIREGVLLLPQILRRAGYRTGIFGKWHQGYEAPDRPNDRGFEEFVGFLGGACPYSFRGGRREILHNTEPYSGTWRHTTDLFTREAVNFIRRHRDEPFFLYVPYNAVHGPLWSTERPRFSAKPEWLEKYRGRGLSEARVDYAATISQMDHGLGEILDALKENGLEENTLVIFMSDNGACLMTEGSFGKYPGNNGTFRSGKGSVYEGGIRVPCLVRWPGVVPGGKTSNQAAIHADLFATILEAAGIPVPEKNGDFPLRGVSLVTHLKAGGATELSPRVVFWELTGKFAVRSGAWKLVGEVESRRADYEETISLVRGGTFELYNLSSDPGERRNLAAEQPAVHDRLKNAFLDYLGRVAERGIGTADARLEGKGQ